jgi:hypothetical protein
MELSEGDEQANNHTEKGNTLNQCGSNDHVGANVSSHFGLTSHGLQGRATNASNTETCSDCSSASTEACEALSNFKKDGQQFHMGSFDRVMKNQ